ncbi:hypothetical protein LCGC14_1611850 [marine sediment metagenome]|uniref:Uncharacterized protein n=1 Tax=marine sediment metagenome TaxID=412755 RepID=A0A0F9I8A5_9ZZZZ
MPQYNLAAPEEQVIVSWLFEPDGYLDFAVRASGGQTARQALAADSNLDVTQWVRDNALTQPEATETGMVWWIWKNDQVNVPPPNRPLETDAWVAVLNTWDASIQAGFNRASQADRNSNTVPIYGAAGTLTGTMPAGAQLAHQQSLINKVLGVLT